MQKKRILETVDEIRYEHLRMTCRYLDKVIWLVDFTFLRIDLDFRSKSSQNRSSWADLYFNKIEISSTSSLRY